MNTLISLQSYQEHIKLVDKYEEKLSDGNLLEKHIANNAIFLHNVYFQLISFPETLNPESPLMTILEKFNGLDGICDQMVTLGNEATGWVILGLDLKDGEIKLDTMYDHSNGLLLFAPLIALDCYEHAYYMDYGSNKQDYLTNFFQVLNWKKVEEYYLNYKRLI